MTGEAGVASPIPKREQIGSAKMRGGRNHEGDCLRVPQRRLALSKETTFWERLSEIVAPRRKIRVLVRREVLVDVCLRGETGRIAADVLLPRRLIYADVVDP